MPGEHEVSHPKARYRKQLKIKILYRKELGKLLALVKNLG